MMVSRLRTYSTLATALLVSFVAVSASAVSSSQSGRIDIQINDLLGADAFFDAGYDGSRSVVGVIESGHIWSGHQTLSHVQTFIDSPQARFNSTRLGDFNRHGTFVAGVLGGRPTANEGFKTGIAPGSTMWSGAIATQWFNTPNTEDSFGFNNDRHALLYPFVTMMQDGIDGRRADVINFSVGLGQGSAAADIAARSIDALAHDNRQAVVVAAGNLGPGSGTIASPADAYNVITVGALGRGGNTPYVNVAGFSSRGPGNFFNPVTRQTVVDARALVDIVAPGENLIAPFYGGTTGQNRGGTDITQGRADRYAGFNPPGPNVGGPISGTSFSTPIVSGAASLLADVAHDRYARGTDGRVIKAVLLNSAVKPGPWNNGQALGADGVIRTTQSLDYTFGAGRLDIAGAFDQFTSGTTDVPGNIGGGVDATGWDLGTVSQNVATDYLISPVLAGGSVFNATLSWFANREFVSLAGNGTTTVNDNSLDDLDLQLWSLSAAAGLKLIAESVSDYNTVEHFSVLLPEDGSYMLRVVWDGEHYDRVEDVNTETFGLAWTGTAIPEPTTAAWLLPLLVVAYHRRRRHRSQSIRIMRHRSQTACDDSRRIA